MSYSVDSIGLKEVSIGQNDKLECVEKFCYLGDMIRSGAMFPVIF